MFIEEYKGFKIYKYNGHNYPYVPLFKTLKTHKFIGIGCSTLFIARDMIDWYIQDEEERLKKHLLKKLYEE